MEYRAQPGPTDNQSLMSNRGLNQEKDAKTTTERPPAAEAVEIPLN